MSKETVPLPTELTAATPVAPDANPLTQYFRHSKISVALPSQGKFWPEGSLDLPVSGEIDVMPLTARDEILLKSPEGLLSGSSVVEAIASCVPSIKNPWLMPAIDVDTVFISIRIASYDHEMEITSKCKHCDHPNTNVLDLRQLIDTIPKGNIKNVKTVGDLTFEFAPYTFEFVNKQNMMRFEQERFTRGLAEAKDADEVMNNEYFKNMFRQLAVHNTEALVIAIKQVSMPTGTIVKDKEQIKEFIDNADRATIKAIRTGLEDMNAAVAMKPVTIECEECDKKYETSIEFNQSNFFE